MQSTSHRGGALESGLEILELLARSEQELGVSDIARKLEMDKANAHRLLSVLKRRRLVDQNEENRRYRAGVEVLSMARKMLLTRTLSEVARSPLRTLWLESGETTHLVCYADQHVVKLDCLLGFNSRSLATAPGSQVPTHCAATGKAIIANLEVPDLRLHLDTIRLTRFTRTTIVLKEALLEHLNRVRNQGYALDDQEFHAGVRCVASPVFDFNGHVVGSVGVSAPAGSMQVDRLSTLSTLVKATCDRISEGLGYAN